VAKTIHAKVGVRQLQKEFLMARPPKVELCFFLQDWEDGYNVGGMFRVADGCGAQKLIMSGRTPVPPDPTIGVTSMGQHRRIPFEHHKHHEDAAKKLIAEGWSLVAVELADGAMPYDEFDYPEKTCIVLGNEGAGVYGAVMRHIASSVYIPMLGKGRSLNVHVAGAIVGFHAVLRGRTE